MESYSSKQDVLIIGGGPAGSTAAALLARAGRSVLVLEKECFPRFKIGESLLPYNCRIFRELGIWERLQKENFPRKTGAQFILADDSQKLQFVFREGRFTEETETIQVERSRFDELLLNHAQQTGAGVLQGWKVNRFRQHTDGIEIDAESKEGENRTFQARYLIDASGRANLTGNQEQLREPYPHLRKFAIFNHFTGVKLDEGEKAGDTVIIRLEDKWFWLIPVSQDKTSVGLVLDTEEFRRSKQSPADKFRECVECSRAVRERMTEAQPVQKFQTTTDFSYFNRKLTGPRLLRAGDAAGFMDPIFSAGVYLAMASGKRAAETLNETFMDEARRERLFAAYEKRVFHAMRFYLEMVEHYYTRPFMELFMAPNPRLDIPAAVNAALAGEFEGGWKIRWRLRVFFWLVKLQHQFPIVPRISFK